ncbi:hypothetical protein [Aestuariibacter salexigens]|uniref:hypothetical protein n=1 Tax=Aestuariibacter salexigens TaxID=226010 RepID=UPI00047A911E|nr:hypothetical protein [Aestuariibacter salexigens]
MMRVLCIGLLLLLTACGGSSGSDRQAPIPEPPPAPITNQLTPTVTQDNLELFAPVQAWVGESVGLSIKSADSDPISSIQWQQISGPEVTIQAAHTQTIGFDIQSPGDYQFTVIAITTSGTERSLSYGFSAQETSSRLVSIRLDHNVSEFGNVSLRVDIPDALQASDIVWQQDAGPDATNWRTQEGDDSVLFFVAPAVDEDQVIQVSVTVTAQDDTTYSDTALISVHNADIDWSGYFPAADIGDRVVTEDMLVAMPGDPHQNALIDCLYSNRLTSSCRFSTLPLIGQRGYLPSVEDIMQRTIVSHPWMAERFEAFLQQSEAGDDIRQLLSATTGVVIAYDIRPAFYWSATGAIYLDPQYLWGTAQERDTLSFLPDPRADNGRDLQFGIFWRYVKNGEYFFGGRDYPVSERAERPFSNIEASLAFLLYHELAHANDFIPPSKWASLNDNDSPLSTTNNDAALSEGFSQRFPLGSQEMKALAQVSFFGETATEQQKAFTSVDIEQFFVPDLAPTYYSYSTIYEDFATLFERFMMAYRFDAYADVGIISIVDNPDVLVTWGQRGRFNDVRLQPRVRDVVSRIIPSLDVRSIQQQLQQPRLLDSNKSWWDNLNLDSEGYALPEEVRNVSLRDEMRGLPTHIHRGHQ